MPIAALKHLKWWN